DEITIQSTVYDEAFALSAVIWQYTPEEGLLDLSDGLIDEEGLLNFPIGALSIEGTIYVAYTDDSNVLRVKMLDHTGWSETGSLQHFGLVTGMSNYQLAWYNGELLLAYKVADHQAHLLSWDGTTWVENIGLSELDAKQVVIYSDERQGMFALYS